MATRGRDTLADKSRRFASWLTGVVVGAGLFSFVLGLTVLVGWYTHNVTLIQVFPAFVPMQYNTALGFVLCGLALLLAIRDKPRLAATAGTMAAAIGILTLVEYVFSVDLGIDQLLRKHYITVEISHPGRMAPNTAICFALIGLASLSRAMLSRAIAGRWMSRSLVPVILGSLAIGLGTVALSGYLTEIETAYGWGRLTRMAIHTAAGFIALGTGMVCFIWRRGLSPDAVLPRWFPVPICMSVLTATVCFWQALEAEFAKMGEAGFLPQGHSHIPQALLIVGILLALAAYLAQTAQRRAAEMESARLVLAGEIADRRRAEEELSRLRNLLKNIVDSMPSVLVGVDVEGRVTQWNLEAEKTTGVAAREAEGSALADVFPQFSYEMAKVRQAIQQRQVIKDEMIALVADGETRYTDVTIYPLVTNGVEGAVIRLDDVTERVRIEEMMIQSEKMLSVGGLAAGMAHEINNPLAMMLQAIQVVLDRVSEDLPANVETAEACGCTLEAFRDYMQRREVPQMLEIVEEAGHRATKIVDNMLSFSRKSTRGAVPCDLGQLIDETVELAGSDYDLKKKYDVRQIEIVREYDPELPQVPCEASKIQQVVLNLLKNGAQAMTGRKDRTKPARFVLRAAREEGQAIVEVEDNGPGMDERTRRRVFEPFLTTREVGVGTGLGLSVSYFIVSENHGGKMTVESTPGKGTKFIIRLPLKGKDQCRQHAFVC